MGCLRGLAGGRDPLGGGSLLPFEAEGVVGRVGVDPEAGLGAGQSCRPQREHPCLGGGDVADADVQMGLLGEGRVWPARRLVIWCVLEAEAGVAVADVNPVPVDSGDRQPEQFGVETRQVVRVGAIDHHRGQPADHRILASGSSSLLMLPGRYDILDS